MPCGQRPQLLPNAHPGFISIADDVHLHYNFTARVRPGLPPTPTPSWKPLPVWSPLLNGRGPPARGGLCQRSGFFESWWSRLFCDGWLCGCCAFCVVRVFYSMGWLVTLCFSSGEWWIAMWKWGKENLHFIGFLLPSRYF